MIYSEIRNQMVEQIIDMGVAYVQAEWEGNLKDLHNFFESHGGAERMYRTPEIKVYLGEILDNLIMRSNAVPHENPADMQKIYLSGAYGAKASILELLKDNEAPELVEAKKLYDSIAKNAILIDFDYFKDETRGKPIGIGGEVYYQVHSRDFNKVRGLFSGLHRRLSQFAEENGYSQIVDNSLAPITPAQYAAMIEGMPKEEGKFKMFAMALTPNEALNLPVNAEKDERDVNLSAQAFADMYEWVHSLSEDTILLSPKGKLLDHKAGSPSIKDASLSDFKEWQINCRHHRESTLAAIQAEYFR